MQNIMKMVACVSFRIIEQAHPEGNLQILHAPTDVEGVHGSYEIFKLRSDSAVAYLFLWVNGLFQSRGTELLFIIESMVEACGSWTL